MPFFISITIETHSVLNLETNVAHIWISVGAVSVEFGPKCCVARCFLPLPCFKSWFVLFVGQITVTESVLMCQTETDFCSKCEQRWNRLSLLIFWGFLRTGLAQESHLFCIALDGYFCTTFLSDPWIHREVFLLAMVPKKRDNICNILYLQLFPILILFYWNTTKFSD